MLTWDDPNERYYQTGVDRGVLYPSKLPVFPVIETNLIQHDVTKYGFASSQVGAGAVASTVPAGGDGYGSREYRRLTIATATTPTAAQDLAMYSASNFGISTIQFSSPVTPGKSYTMIVPVRCSIAQKVIGEIVGITATTGSGSKGSSTVTLVPNVWTLIAVENYVPSAGVVGARVDINHGTAPLTWTVGATFDIGRPAFYESDVLPAGGYFDGATTDDLYKYEWTGTPGYSTSVQRQIVGTAIPWNGITGIDENSNTSSSVLYRDGRVYLADVDPGDFEGSLSCYMWPDEFSLCMGIPEATDGLYVDNQKPKRFNLSYRSLIGSGSEGDMFGYQIHLLYNLMAQPGARSRKTLNDTPTPMDFTFGLVATPVTLPGFRPSAHYILDTRHMDAQTISQLEDILYGSATQAPRMPTPTELYDLMNFGSAITFVDHGDGTWTARGAYANVHMTGPDTWEILNVNGTDHGDGTFTLEDTP